MQSAVRWCVGSGAVKVRPCSQLKSAIEEPARAKMLTDVWRNTSASIARKRHLLHSLDPELSSSSVSPGFRRKSFRYFSWIIRNNSMLKVDMCRSETRKFSILSRFQ